MKETDRSGRNQMVMDRPSSQELDVVAHHYINPDASHFEEPLAWRDARRERERRFIAEKNPKS